MWRQGLHSLDDPVRLRRSDSPVQAMRDHFERGVLSAREVHVVAGDSADERKLKHGLKPYGPGTGVSEHLDEKRVEGSQVKQSLVDIECKKLFGQGSIVR